MSQIREHIGVYGAYGLGLGKAWGMRSGVSPVLYVYRESPLPAFLSRSMLWTPTPADSSRPDGDSWEHLWNSLFELACFLKPYEGPFFRNGRLFDRVRFYDEREWRYVPALGVRPLPYGLDEADYENLAHREAANRVLWDRCRLSFEPSDINFVVVAREAEILPMIQEIERVKSPKYSPDQVKVLSSRMISTERIGRDI